MGRLEVLEELSEENVIRAQMAFEQRLDSTVDLPDGIRGKQAYIYRNLMRKWFDDLVAKHGFDEVMARKIRSDWLNYMELIESQGRSSFLSLECENRNKQASYEKAAWEEQNRVVAIEDRFAAALGREAMSELRSVRDREAQAFDRTGQKKIAPVGFHYFPVSINPYIEELQKD